MSTVKSGGSTKNLRDSQPKFLGVKLTHGAEAQSGSVIVRQRGTRILAGKNVAVGKDHTLFALKPGVVTFGEVRKKRFDNTTSRKKIVSVV